MTRRVLPFVASLFLLSGCGKSPAEKAAIKNKALYREFVEEVLNKKQVQKAGDYIAPEFIDHSLPPGTMGSLANFQAWLTEFQTAFPDGNWTLDVLVADGDSVAQSKTFFGSQKASYQGSAASGKSVTVVDVGLARFNEGKMVEFWGHFDKDALLRQIRGAAPKPAAKPAVKKSPAASKTTAKPAAKKTPTKKPTPKPATKKKTSTR